MADLNLTQQGTASADSTNVKGFNQQLSQLSVAISSSGTDVLTALASIAAAITASIIGGSTGTTANRLLRSKGTTARALQNTTITCDDSGNLSDVGNATFVSASALRTGTSAGNTLLFQARDVDGAAYTTFATLTANNTPTFDLAAATTKGGNGIAIVTQTFVWSWYFPNALAKDYKLVINSPIACTVNSITTISESGTCTLTGKINTTPLGGTANSVSTSEQTQTHTTANSLAVGDDFVLAPSSISSLVGMTATVKITVSLAAS